MVQSHPCPSSASFVTAATTSSPLEPSQLPSEVCSHLIVMASLSSRLGIDYLCGDLLDQHIDASGSHAAGGAIHHLPELDEIQGKHTKGDQTGSKAKRPETRWEGFCAFAGI